MRESEFFDKIIEFGLGEDAIRAAWLNGSRANENAPRDILQDFDVVFVTDKIENFIENRNWLTAFGKIAVSQEGVMAEENGQIQSYLIMTQFCDVNRMDCAFVRISYAEKSIGRDSLTLLLFDKDKRFDPALRASENDYRVKAPGEKEFLSCCNNFWWVLPYVAKGLRRGEIFYALEHLYELRGELFKQLRWKIAACDPAAVTGKCNKYIGRYLSEREYRQLLSCFVSAKLDEVRAALFKTAALFSKTALAVARSYGFLYNEKEEAGAKTIAKQILELPDIDR